MPDIASVFTLTTPGTDITFNNGTLGGGSQDDMYWITAAPGLPPDGAPRRAPVDNRPQTDGGLVHRFFKGPRQINVEGLIAIQSTTVQDTIRSIRNAMEEALEEALDAIYQADGTLAWTPAGQSPYSLTVRNNIEVKFEGDVFRTFTFGLIAGTP